MNFWISSEFSGWFSSRTWAKKPIRPQKFGAFDSEEPCLVALEMMKFGILSGEPQLGSEIVAFFNHGGIIYI